MAMSPMQKMQKSIEASKHRVQKRRDVKDERNAGIYSNGVNAYLDEDGHPLDSVEIPHWFKNLSKAWQSNRLASAQRRREELDSIESTKPVTNTWNQWCDNRVDMLGEECDPRNPKPKIGRPRLPDYLKKSPTKVKRSDEMEALLLEHGIHLSSKPSKDGLWEDIFLAEQSQWQFLPNGRLRREEEAPVSVHHFLKNLNGK